MQQKSNRLLKFDSANTAKKSCHNADTSVKVISPFFKVEHI